METGVGTVVTVVTAWLPRIGVGIAIVVAAWIAAAMIDAVVRRMGERSRIEPDLLHLFRRSARIGLMLFAVVTALGTVGINVSALVAGLGLTGFALGFALKDILSNVLAGVLILFYRPFSRHDRVAVAGHEGTVEEIDLRYTTLVEGDTRFLIPNSTLFTNAIAVRGGVR